MTDITTTTKPARVRKSVILTDRMCERRVEERVKVYDAKARGLFASLTVAGITTFSFKFTDPATGKQRTAWLGVHSPEFRVEDARAKAYALKAMGRAALVEELRQNKAVKGRHGRTVAEIIALRIAWMSGLELKKDGEMRPRVESWRGVASHLNRLVLPRLGKMIAADVTRRDIAELSSAILAGQYGKASTSNARHMRRAVSGLYSWAAEPAQDYVPETCRPTYNLGKLPREHARERVLSEDEIRIFWHGLSRNDLPWDRRTRLALKFQLATMLRGGELIAAHTSELFDLDGDAPCFRIPARRVKKRRIVEQPLSDLAVEIIKEALATNVAAGQKKTNENNIQKSAGPANAAPHGFVFESPMYPGQPLHRSALATALRGDRKTKGLCELLGLQPLRPHDLRRTSATLAGELGYSESAIAKTLDHAITKDDGEKINRVTGIYNQSRRAKQKRAVLDGIAAELRRIIGEPTVTVADPDELRLAA